MGIISDAIQAMVKPLLKPFERVVFPCTVVGVYDSQTNTIKVKSYYADGLEFDALLSADTTGSYSLVVVPAQNSLVWVTRPPLMIGFAHISKYTTIDKVLAKVGNSTLEWEATNGTLTLNGGNNKGVPMAPQVVVELNTIKMDISVLKNAIIAAPVTPGDGGATFKASLVAAWANSGLANTTLNDIQNTKIKQ